MVDEQGAIWMPTANRASRGNYRPRFIVLHGTAGGSRAEDIAAYFQRSEGGANPVSSHYVIGRDGVIVQLVRESDVAFANGVLTAGHAPYWREDINPNLLSISIEHCKPSDDNSDALTVPQQASSFALIKHICERWDIPMREAIDALGGITGHFSIDPVSRSRCPGYYPVAALWEYLKGGSDNVLTIQGASGYYEEVSADIWRCRKNGFLVGHGMLKFYKSFGGGALFGLTHLGLPLMNEAAIAGVPGATKQHFERGVLVYDPQHVIDNPPGSGPVYTSHIYNSVGVDPRIAPLVKQVADLQAQAAQSEHDAAMTAIEQIKSIVQQF